MRKIKRLAVGEMSRGQLIRNTVYIVIQALILVALYKLFIVRPKNDNSKKDHHIASDCIYHGDSFRMAD